MKRLVLVIILSILSLTAVSASGFYVTPSAAVNVGIGNYLRGGAVAGQAFYDFGFIAVGLEVKADYDVGFNVFNVPMMLLIGFGRDFWIGAGYTLGIGSPSITGTNGTAIPWTYGGFPNTYALGVNVFRLPLPFGALLVQSEINYTVNSPVNAADSAGLGMLIGALAGLKGSVGVGVEMKL
jgi:hypothetical protein